LQPSLNLVIRIFLCKDVAGKFSSIGMHHPGKKFETKIANYLPGMRLIGEVGKIADMVWIAMGLWWVDLQNPVVEKMARKIALPYGPRTESSIRLQ
jgi:hypothetical protein